MQTSIYGGPKKAAHNSFNLILCGELGSTGLLFNTSNMIEESIYENRRIFLYILFRDSGGDLLPPVLDVLNEIVFQPQFLTSPVEKERRAILSELQMMNTIEYCVDCQLLQHLHSENKLGKRLPIGLEEQIKKLDADKMWKFHERWYFPANATLYIVGDIDNISKSVYHIEIPVNKLQTYGDLRNFLMKRVFLSALHFRIQTRYQGQFLL
ncbi:hypothetical protein RHSIM_Rhsim02G0141800 [Rhododendron simsii]|uniref:Peptidase M16 C-terminal domain-containing protein n=1 Tax=Rhododendron simsii TaxID=118357 RepID=A0A834HEU5_RHOSS|nr:hypothetical protein RHSIM_Rhsim02G0141800 [Rhododendron simsii]